MSLTGQTAGSLLRIIHGSRRWPGTLLCGFTALMLAAGGCVGRQHTRKADWISVARREAIPLSQLAERVRRYRIVSLGEGHALVEPIETLRMLLSETNRHGWTHVAFEWSVSDQPGLDRFMAGDDAVLQRFRKLYGQLPGATTEYVDTFSFIRERNRAHPDHLIQVCAVDVPHPVRNVAEEERDRHMFACIEKIIEASPNHRVVVHCGANHNMKSGLVEQTKREGGTVPRSPLGALLCQRYPGMVVSIRVLDPSYDPIWKRLKDEALLQHAVAIPTSDRWPSPLGSLGFYRWHPEESGAQVSIKSVYDYLVWWPTSRDAKREQ